MNFTFHNPPLQTPLLKPPCLFNKKLMSSYSYLRLFFFSLQFFLAIFRPELLIASVAQGYKVSNTIEPVKTDDCHSECAICPHEPKGRAKKHKQQHQNKMKKVYSF